MSTLFALPNLGRFWTIPNVLGLLRIALVVPLTMLLWVNGPLGWVLGLTLVIILSDWFDGRVARWTNSVSEWGKIIDPVSDKFAALMTVSALTFRAAEPQLPLWFFGVVVGRDVLILLGGILVARRSGTVLMSAWAGKAASLWLALTVTAIILRADPPVLNACIWMTTGLLALSFLVYCARYVHSVWASSDPDGTPPRASEGDAEVSLGPVSDRVSPARSDG